MRRKVMCTAAARAGRTRSCTVLSRGEGGIDGVALRDVRVGAEGVREIL
jgi:hypothetical protein